MILDVLDHTNVIDLFDSQAGQWVSGQVRRLNTGVAGRLERQWWRGQAQTACSTHYDRVWDWGHIASESFLEFRDGLFVSVSGQGQRVQGAITYRWDAQSLLEPEEGAFMIEYLASAPWNRNIASPRTYKGVGKGLTLLAVIHSYILGMGGRVVVESLEGAQSFYAGLGFQDTNKERHGKAIYELLPKNAQALLKSEGFE